MLKAGRQADRLAFMQSGIIREFVLLEDKDITKWICTEGYFVLDMASFMFRVPARWNYQALTDCELFVLDHKDYINMGQHIKEWSELEKRFISKCFMVLEDRVITHLAMTAQERYQHLFNYNPYLFNQVPLQYLASMLGITPETLSRLRKKGAH